MWRGILGLWLSPAKGVLVFSPILILGFYGMYYYFRHCRKFKLEVSVAIIVILHSMALGKWYAWYGGYCWGYRMMTEIIPYMVLMIVPFVNSDYFRQKAWGILFWVLLIYSILIQMLGIVYFDSVWHTLFDGKPGWLWNIENSQILFSIKRGLYKLGMMESPHYLIK